jgi:arginine decarboxylase
MGAGFEQGSVFHVQGDLVDTDRLSACADLLMTTSPNVMIYAAIDGWRRQMVERGGELLGAALDLAGSVRREIDAIPGLRVLEDRLLGREASHDLDRLQILVDVSEVGISGYRCADWLREHERVDVGLGDHRLLLATLSMADDRATGQRLVDALCGLVKIAPGLEPTAPIYQPEPDELQLSTVMLPRDAFFGPTEMVAADSAPGRTAAEQLTPYPPGVPVVVPGEELNAAVVEYLQSGLRAGMVIPDATDPALDRFRVVRG